MPSSTARMTLERAARVHSGRGLVTHRPAALWCAGTGTERVGRCCPVHVKRGSHVHVAKAASRRPAAFAGFCSWYLRHTDALAFPTRRSFELLVGGFGADR